MRQIIFFWCFCVFVAIIIAGACAGFFLFGIYISVDGRPYNTLAFSFSK